MHRAVHVSATTTSVRSGNLGLSLFQIQAAMFSLVFLAVIAVAGLIFWVYFWWKTRAIRAQIEEQMRAQAQYRDTRSQTAGTASDGDVIEGEAVRVAESERMLGQKDDPPA